ncbi:MAG: cyclic nucleotide-binding domain-containing protein [Thermodesulfobacteriota bacterium]|nr:cyclic nucleotide-binding domain-containing protein [Thermodesulfobacteriota bacterium]
MNIIKLIYSYVASEETHPDKAVIVKEGSKGNWVYVVLEGQVKVKKGSQKGMVTLYTLKKGDIFGEMILLQAGEGTRTTSVIADGPVRVGVLNTDQLLSDYDSVSPQLKGLIRSLMLRLEKTTEMVVAKAAE